MTNDENNTKELDNLKEIVENPTKPALEIQDKENDIEKKEETQEKVTKEDKKKKNKKSLKEKIKEKWNKFSKKEKVLIIISSIIVLILIIVLIVILATKNKDNKKLEPKKPDVIIEKDNYRYENGNLVFLDENDKDLGQYECTNKDENQCYVAYFELDEHIDTTKVLDEEGNLVDRRVPILNNRYAFVYDNDEKSKNESLVLYDIKSKEKIGEYYGIKLADVNNSIVKDKSGSYGVIKIVENKTEQVLAFNYDDISSFNDEMHAYYMVNDNGRNYLLSFSNKPFSKAISSYIVDYNDKYIVGVNDAKEYYLYDYNGKQIFDEPYQYIKIYKDYVALVKDNKLYIKYYDKNKYHEVGYALSPKYQYYNRVNVVDENGKVLDDYVPFDVVKNTTTLTVIINDKNYVINLKEGEISKNTDYVNYFDGIIYIYNDQLKENLIGEYKCTNQNVFTTNTDKFENCFITDDTAKQDNDMSLHKSSGMIPIINNRYVFIHDNPNAVSQGNNNVVLYDLNEKKVLSKYLSVNTNLNSEVEMPTFRTDSDIRIIAQNRNSKYGILMLNSEGKMASLVPFNYSSIENMGASYLCYDGSYYTIIDRNGKEIIRKRLSNRIRGYNNTYLKVTEGNNYYIYDYDGNKLNKTGFKYIELHEKYYVGVSIDNKLNIYSYDKEFIETPLLKDSIQLISDKYYGETLIAFQASIVEDTATIYTLNSNEKYDSSTYTLVKPSLNNTNVENNIESVIEDDSEA